MKKWGYMKSSMDAPKKNDNAQDLKLFLLGLVMLAVGIYLVFDQTSVSTSMYVWRIGTFGVPTGIVCIPMFIGIIMLFYNRKSVISWIVFLSGLAFIIVTIILSVQIRFRATSLLVYVFMFGLILGGLGLLIKTMFPKKN